MTLRFRRSIKLAPGVRWNVSGAGSSWTFGPRGASISVGKRGTFLNTGIPGTGLTSRTLVAGASTQSRGAAVPRLAPPAATTNVSLTCVVDDNGTLSFVDGNGQPASEYLVDLAKRQKRDALVGLIKQACDKVNGEVEALGRLHHDTPDPHIKPRFSAPEYEEAAPAMAKPLNVGFWDKVFRTRRARIDEANRNADARYEEEMLGWRSRKREFEVQLARRKLLVEKLIYESVDAMEIFLEESLQDVTWPRETSVALEVRDAGTGVVLDVDFPEIEDMPTKLATVPTQGLKLSVKELSSTKVKRLYAEHVHGILFRLVGEAFAALPTLQWVCAAGYTQRRDPTTAHLQDDYLLSVRVARVDWNSNDFAHLPSIDVVEAMTRYDLRRDMLKTGQLKAITPH